MVEWCIVSKVYTVVDSLALELAGAPAIARLFVAGMTYLGAWCSSLLNVITQNGCHAIVS